MITDTRERIYTYICKHEKVRVHDLVKKFQLSNVAIHKQVKKLLNEGKIEKTGNPPMVFYIKAKALPDLEELKKRISPVIKKAGIKKAALFGSYVRGDNTQNSDIDILVKYPPKFSLFDVVGLKYDLEDTLEKKVDLVSFRGINPRIKESVLENLYPIL